MSRSATHADGPVSFTARAAALLVLVALVAPLHARAQGPEPVALEWEAPAGCPDAQDVLARIRKLSVTWPPTGLPLRAAATIRRSDDGQLRLTLVVHAGALMGERTIASKACDFLANATAIHLALLLNQQEPAHEQAAAVRGDPEDGESAPTNTPDGLTTTSSQANASADRARPGAVPSSDDEHSARSWRVLLQLPLASFQLGPLPRPSFGLALAAGITVEQWQVLAAGHAWLAQSVTSKDEPDVGASVERVSANLQTCRAAAWSSFELAPCIHVSLEHVWARGTGSHVAPRTARATWLAAGVGVRTRVLLWPWFGLVAAAHIQLETARPRISIDGVGGSLGRLGPAAILLTLGTEWIL
jgi:hypothetical protein